MESHNGLGVSHEFVGLVKDGPGKGEEERSSESSDGESLVETAESLLSRDGGEGAGKERRAGVDGAELSASLDDVEGVCEGSGADGSGDGGRESGRSGVGSLGWEDVEESAIEDEIETGEWRIADDRRRRPGPETTPSLAA